MSEASAGYAFLPWCRRGAATAIERVDGTGPSAPRARFPVSLQFAGRDPVDAPTVHLELQGPGEVVGVDRRMIVRTYPAPDVFDAESNYFPLVEFDSADFPWRYTPAAATPEDRLRPWLVLIALADGEIAAATAADPLREVLPTVTVANLRWLPDLAQSWAWAHVQVEGLDAGQAGQPALIDRIDREEPQRTVARLLCARHLQPRTAYTVLLVPGFERGRLAGLGLDPAELDALLPAWDAGRNAPLVLPVYYQWRFQTGEAGDFESLVRELLPPKVLPASVGRRALDVGQPGQGLPSASPAADGLLSLEGALMSPACRDSLPPWPDRQPFVGRLEALLNTPADLLTEAGRIPVIAPPLYGRWPAGRLRLQAGRSPSWFDELNADPRLRAVSGLGAAVVRDQQNQLLAAAWDQVDGVLEANRLLRQAQLGIATASRLVDRHLARLASGATLEVTAPVLGRIMASPRTISATLKDSPMPRGVLDTQWRRAVRPLGPLGRRYARALGRRGRFGVAAIPAGELLERLNRGELALPPLAVGTRLPSLAKTLQHAALPTSGWRYKWQLLLALAALVLLVAAVVVPVLPGPGVLLACLGLAATWAAVRARRAARRRGLLVGLAAGRLDAAAIWDTPAARGFAPRERGYPDAIVARDPVAEPAAITATESTTRFKTALAGLAERLEAPRPAAAARDTADLTMLHGKVLKALRPERTIPRAVGRRLGLPVQPDRDAEDRDTAPWSAAPVFDHPMYEPLRDLSGEWLLPGVGAVPPNTVSLLVANRRFIEAYLLGLNHEMARELLWHEYPTERRATFFRQFWDVRGQMGASAEGLRDIRPIREWGADTALGSHPADATATPAEPLVLLVRGRLLQRYPEAVVLAVRATRSDTGEPVLGTEERYPRFHGRMDPDLVFVGFDLTADEVRGNADTGGPGWFFVFQELPGAPRFGLEAADGPQPNAASWQELSWGHLVRSREELATLAYINLDPAPRYAGDDLLPVAPPVAAADPPGLAWHAPQGSRSSDLAYITMRRPFRIAIHGSRMLPAPE